VKPDFSDLAVDTKADAMLALLGGGHILIFSGSRPESADIPFIITPTTVLLTRVPLADPAFGASRGGYAQMQPVASAPGLADGLPAWFRFVTRQGVALFDGDIPEHIDMRNPDTGELEPIKQDGEVFIEGFEYVEAKR
jgi:hypothetical protein